MQLLRYTILYCQNHIIEIGDAAMSLFDRRTLLLTGAAALAAGPATAYQVPNHLRPRLVDIKDRFRPNEFHVARVTSHSTGRSPTVGRSATRLVSAQQAAPNLEHSASVARRSGPAGPRPKQ